MLHFRLLCAGYLLFFFNDTATTEIYTLSLHDALPISQGPAGPRSDPGEARQRAQRHDPQVGDRKSTRLNSSHGYISYAVFCLKKKKQSIAPTQPLADVDRERAAALVDRHAPTATEQPG